MGNLVTPVGHHTLSSTFNGKPKRDFDFCAKSILEVLKKSNTSLSQIKYIDFHGCRK